MEKLTYKVMTNSIKEEEILNIFKEELINNSKFKSDVKDELISVELGYLAYDFYYGKLEDLEYLVVQDEKEISSKLNIELDMPSAEFIINGLSRNNEFEELDNIDSIMIFNYDDLLKHKDKFLDNIIMKVEEMICKRHNVFLKRKNQRIDISPIRVFKEYTQEIYLEPVYRIYARTKHRKKAMISLYSGVTKKFYELNYLYSDNFENFYKKFRNPVVYVPKYLINEYYDLAFDVYLKTIEEIKYIKESDLLKKIKINIRYHEYTKYKDYLYQGIFYFKKSSYLEDYYVDIHNIDIKRRLLDLYLTVSYQSDSGLILAEYSQLGICEYNDLKEWINFLTKAYRLGNLEAKKKLFDHYLKPNYYDEFYLKRYS